MTQLGFHNISVEQRQEEQKGYQDQMFGVTNTYLVCTCGDFERQINTLGFREKKSDIKIEVLAHILGIDWKEMGLPDYF